MVALVTTLVFQFTGDELPEGWKRYDEYRMQLSVAAPGDWKITTEGTPRRLNKTLVVVASRQERLTLTVSLPAGKQAEKTADDLLSKARGRRSRSATCEDARRIARPEPREGRSAGRVTGDAGGTARRSGCHSRNGTPRSANTVLGKRCCVRGSGQALPMCSTVRCPSCRPSVA
ncbi:hypothetical protein ACIRNI_28350 [Streptomyces sp. NPDC093546]|uniref:hypothetical protein n=1 Tax=Streptomyces sp. NPDC093546 TaxID=3366040 RepID=UPI003825966A